MAFENFDYETITKVAIKSTVFFGIGAVIVLAASGGEFEQSDFKWLVIGGAGLLISLLLYFIRFFLDQGWIARLLFLEFSQVLSVLVILVSKITPPKPIQKKQSISA